MDERNFSKKIRDTIFYLTVTTPWNGPEICKEPDMQLLAAAGKTLRGG